MPSKSSCLSSSHESRGFHCERELKLKSKSRVSSKCFIASSPLPTSGSLSQKKFISFCKVSSAADGLHVDKNNTKTQNTVTKEVRAGIEKSVYGVSQYQVLADTGTHQNFLINLPTSGWSDKCQNSLKKWAETNQSLSKKDLVSRQYRNFFLCTNFTCEQSKHNKTSECGKDVLLIGGDLLIAKTQGSSCESADKTSDIRIDSNERFLGTSATTDSLTIEKIEYKCEVLQKHSKECGCWTPRLHVYLTGSHRCSDLCVINNFTNNPVNGSDSTFGTSSTGYLVKICTPPDMTGKSKGKNHVRKSASTRKLSNKKETQTGRNPKVNEPMLERNLREKFNSVTNTCQDDEPESELLAEGECVSLPTIMSTLSGDVEYIVLDDNTLNLSASTEEVVSSDALKFKINNIYEDIDEKPIIHNTDSKLTNRKEGRCRQGLLDRRLSDSGNQLMGSRSFSRVVDSEKTNDEHSTGNSNDTASSSLAGVCTNRCPSIKDIFGDVSIKEEPLDDVKHDMTVDDFSKEISKLSDMDFDLKGETEVKKQETEADEYDESKHKGLFAKLIKEEATTGDEIDIDTHSSDDSLGPLQIDEDRFLPSLEDTNLPLVKEVSEFNMPSVNIISPFKIKILLGSPNRESFQIQAGQSQSGIPMTSSLLNRTNKVRKNGMTTLRKYEQGLKKEINKDPEIDIALAALTATTAAHTIQSLTCIYCNTECSNGEALAKHFENHQKEGLIICYFCQKSFGDKTGMKRHMRTHTGEKPYQCKVCGKRFSLPGNFKKHRDIHEDRRTEPCNLCGKTFRRKEHLKYHMRTHTGEKPYTCSECGTSFTARYSLQIHMNIHLGKKPYECTYCNKAFSDKSTMRKHVRVHTGEKPFRCQECRRCFGESGTLAAHMATHRTDRPYKCDKCDLRFKTTGGLRQHEKVHSGEKQFACRFCGMRFLQKYNMTMHERIHTGEKPYTCSHCQRSFRSRSCLAKHIVLHGGDDERRFHCEHCSSRFYRKAHLRRHIDMHLGIKNYECNACSKKFCTRGTLKNHLKTFHSHGARRFPCNWCGRVFKRKVYVSTHVCAKNPVKSEAGEQEMSNQHPGSNHEEGTFDQNNSSDSEGSSVEVKSEPEDEQMEGADDGDEDEDDEDNDDDGVEGEEFMEVVEKNVNNGRIDC